MAIFAATPQMSREMSPSDAELFLKATKSLHETLLACPTCHSGKSAARVLAAAHNGLPLSLHDPDQLGQDAKDLIRIALRYGTHAADGVPIHWSEMDKVFEGLVRSTGCSTSPHRAYGPTLLFEGGWSCALGVRYP